MDRAPNRPLKIACIGEAMIEVSHQDTAGAARIGIAGDTFNTAVYLRRLLPDASVSYVTALGTDRPSEMIFEAARSHGLETNLIERRPGLSPGLYMIFTDPQGERSFSYWRSASAARTLFAAPRTVAPGDLSECDLVYFSGITLAIIAPQARAELLAWLAAFRSQGGRVAFDPNYRPALWASADEARAAMIAAFAQTDIALPSLDDEIALFGGGEAETIARLLAAGIGSGALKRGASGPVALDGSGEAPEVATVAEVVDTTGAGDSFNAGFLAKALSGGSIFDAMTAGHALAAKVVQHRGAILPLVEKT